MVSEGLFLLLSRSGAESEAKRPCRGGSIYRTLDMRGVLSCVLAFFYLEMDMSRSMSKASMNHMA